MLGPRAVSPSDTRWRRLLLRRRIHRLGRQLGTSFGARPRNGLPPRLRFTSPQPVRVLRRGVHGVCLLTAPAAAIRALNASADGGPIAGQSVPESTCGQQGRLLDRPFPLRPSGASRGGRVPPTPCNAQEAIAGADYSESSIVATYCWRRTGGVSTNSGRDGPHPRLLGT
jgi:hypothetical protein